MGPVAGFGPVAPKPGLPASGFASVEPGFAATTGSVAGLGGIPEPWLDPWPDPCPAPCGALAVEPGAAGFTPPVADDVDEEAIDAVDAGAGVAGAGVTLASPPGEFGCPGRPDPASGFRLPDPGLSASLGGGVTGRSSNSSCVAVPP